MLEKIDVNAEVIIKQYNLEWVRDYEGSSEDLVQDLKEDGYKIKIVSRDKAYDAAWNYDTKQMYVKEGQNGEQYDVDKYTIMHELLHAKQGKRGENYMIDNEYDAYCLTWRYDPKVSQPIEVNNIFLKPFFGDTVNLRDLTVVTFSIGVIGSSSQLAN